MNQRKQVSMPKPGLKCPRCGCRDLRQDTGWNVKLGRRRRKICRSCSYHVYTLETATDTGESNGGSSTHVESDDVKLPEDE